MALVVPTIEGGSSDAQQLGWVSPTQSQYTQIQATQRRSALALSIM